MSRVADEESVRTLLRHVRQLELVGRYHAMGTLRGDYATAVRGHGLTFHEVRKYSPGESARFIDWNITARVGEPHVRVHEEERRRDLLLVVDVSPSMAMGTQAISKLELAVELAATLAVTAIDQGDRLGLVAFADRVVAREPPRGGRVQLFRVLRELVRQAGAWNRPVAVSDPRQAIHAIEQSRRGRYVIFLISDFIDHDLDEDLAFLRARHDVSLLRVFDPMEEIARPGVRFRAVAPEGERAPQRLGGGTEPFTSVRDADALRRLALRQRMTWASFSTAEPLRPALDTFLHQKRRRLCR